LQVKDTVHHFIDDLIDPRGGHDSHIRFIMYCMEAYPEDHFVYDGSDPLEEQIYDEDHDEFIFHLAVASRKVFKASADVFVGRKR
jgi:hypothetical protein